MIPLLFVACTTPPGDSSGLPAEWTSDAGLYTVVFSSETWPPVAGDTHFDVTVDGATSLGFDALMSAMGHGLSGDPVITGADGDFDVDCVFPMSGTWTLTWTLDGDAGPDTATGDLEVG